MAAEDPELDLAEARAAGELLLPSEAGAMLRLDSKTMTRWHKRGLIDAVVLPSGHHRFWRADIEAILRRGGKPGRAPVPHVDGQMVLPLAGLLDEALQAKYQELHGKSQA